MRPVTPLLTVDVVIRLADQPAGSVVLIKRLNPPHGWALPGGFVDLGETVEQAAVREAREETGLDVKLTGLLGCYSDPGRDPRGHTVSIVYTADAQGDPHPGDDAREVRVFEQGALPALVFDHAAILQDHFSKLVTP